MKKIKEFLKRKKVSLGQLAKELGFSEVHICRVLNERCRLSQLFITRLNYFLEELQRRDSLEVDRILEEIRMLSKETDEKLK